MSFRWDSSCRLFSSTWPTVPGYITETKEYKFSPTSTCTVFVSVQLLFLLL